MFCLTKQVSNHNCIEYKLYSQISKSVQRVYEFLPPQLLSRPIYRRVIDYIENQTEYQRTCLNQYHKHEKAIDMSFHAIKLAITLLD